MKIHWLGLIVVAVLCIAMDVFICRRLRRTGHPGLAWFNAALAVLTAGLATAVAVMPLSEATTSPWQTAWKFPSGLVSQDVLTTGE